MDLTLRSIWEPSNTPKQRLVLIHADASQNSLPLLRKAIIEALKSVPDVIFLTRQLTGAYRTDLTTVIFLATAVPTESLVPYDNTNLVRIDWSDQVPYYEWKDPCPELFQAVRNGLPNLLPHLRHN